MSFKTERFDDHKSFLEYLSHFDTNELVVIVPNLDLKKRLVLEMAQIKGTVPDGFVLRLQDFFVSLVSLIAPGTELLDKKIFQLYLKQELEDQFLSTQELHIIDRAIEYISVFSPIIANKNYRQVFEEYIAEDEIFNKIYEDLYPVMIKIWDFVVSKPVLINQWSLGWAFKNIDKLSSQKKTVILYKTSGLKKVEKDFFEELSRIWDLNSILIESTVNSFKKELEDRPVLYNWYKVLAPINEVELISKLVFEKKIDIYKSVFVIPKNKIEYVNLLEIYLNKYLGLTRLSPVKDKYNFYQFKKIINSLKQQKQYLEEQNDIDSETFKKQFKSFKNYNKISSNLNLYSNSTKISHQTNYIFPKVNFYQFVHQLKSENVNSSYYDDFISWLRSQIDTIPEFIKLNKQNWLLHLESMVLKRIEYSLKKSIFNVQFIEDVEFVEDQCYFILGCTQQNYEVNGYSYLTEFEIDKLKNDLGFNFESMEFSDTLYSDFDNLLNLKQSPSIYFLTPEYSIDSEKENSPKFLDLLLKEKKCFLNQDYQDKEIIDFQSVKKRFISEVKIDLTKNINRSYQSASSIQKYINCPFVYLNEYVYGQKVDDELDIDISNLLKGSLLHGALEKYLDDPQINSEKIQTYFSGLVRKEYKYWNNFNLIETQTKESSEIVTNYIIKDIEEKKIQDRVTVFKEYEFSAYFDLDKLTFCEKRVNATDIKITGKIDRIDKIEDRYYIFDYKLSKGYSLNDWKKEFLIQMPLYGLMFIDGVLPIKGELSQLSYLIIKEDFKIKPGLVLKQEEDRLNLNLNLRSTNSKLNFEEFKEELEKFRVLIKEALVNINKYSFEPAPYDIDNCLNCDWKDSCHAKHLG